MRKITYFLITLVCLSACQHTDVAEFQRGPDFTIVPQWHLNPQVNTKQKTDGKYPQSANQLAIYKQIVDWVKQHKVNSVIVEGCQGEIKPGFKDRFNGWNLEDLTLLDEEHLDNTITQIGIKLAAKFGDKLQVICGDNVELIKKHQLVLSDLRGLLGFKVRINQFKNEPNKQDSYIKAARDVLKLPTTSSNSNIINKINEELKLQVNAFEQILKERDLNFIKVAKSSPHPTAIVIGALHVNDLKQNFDSNHDTVEIFNSPGLNGDESMLLENVKKILNE